MPARQFTFARHQPKIASAHNGQVTIMHLTSKSNAQLARAAMNLGIGVVGLFIVRLIVQFMPMFQEAGWIVQDKLSVVAAAEMAVDAILISILAIFALQLRAWLLGRFAEIPGLGTMAANLVLLLCAALAYLDFKPVTAAWPGLTNVYLWIFFAVALVQIAHLVVLLYQNRDRVAALLLRQPLPPTPMQASGHAEVDPVLVGR
jgi:hypothetical protein